MIPAEYHLPFFDTPLGFTLVVLAIITGFYLFIGRIKTPGDYHRQGLEIEQKAEERKKMQQGNSQEAVQNGEKGEKIEKVSSSCFGDVVRGAWLRRSVVANGADDCVSRMGLWNLARCGMGYIP
jgi:hypothetical protein